MKEEERRTPEFSYPLALDELDPGERRELRLEADETARRALAHRFGLERLDDLHAELRVFRVPDGVAIEGTFNATGAQVCVVSFAPVPFRHEGAPIRLRLLREEALRRHEEELGEALFEEEIDHDLLEGDVIDLGEIVAQSMALALDPYPRADEPAREVLSRHGVAAAAEKDGRARSAPDGGADSGARNPLRNLGRLLAEHSATGANGKAGGDDDG